MRKIIDIWYGRGSGKNFTITDYKEAWKENGIKPFLSLRTNGARRRNVNKNNTCLSITLTLWYIDICYTNFELQQPNLLDKLFSILTPYGISCFISGIIYLLESIILYFLIEDKVWAINISFLIGMLTMLLNISYIYPKSEVMIKNAKTRLYNVSNDGNAARD